MRAGLVINPNYPQNLIVCLFLHNSFINLFQLINSLFIFYFFQKASLDLHLNQPLTILWLQG